MDKLTWKTIVALVVITVLSMAYFQRHILASMTVMMTDYVEISPNLYVDSLFSTSEQKHIIATFNNAQNRVSTQYGALTSTPVIIVASNSTRAKKFGVVAPVPGTTNVVPWGQYIALSDRGHNIDVMAHELVHTETAHRLGYIKWMLALPVWFKEGIAMQVDHRKKYRIVEDGLPAIATLESADNFYSGNITLNYVAAKSEIATWLSADHNLYAFLEKIKAGENFTQLYK